MNVFASQCTELAGESLQPKVLLIAHAVGAMLQDTGLAVETVTFGPGVPARLRCSRMYGFSSRSTVCQSGRPSRVTSRIVLVGMSAGCRYCSAHTAATSERIPRAFAEGHLKDHGWEIGKHE